MATGEPSIVGADSPERIERVLFGDFELRRPTLELLRDGKPVPLQRQPAKVLDLLLDNPGALVSRAQLQRHVWGTDIQVDFDQGLNYCMKQIRRALGDSADTPRYIATEPRRGYRFLASVRVAEPPQEPDSPVDGTWLRRVGWRRWSLGALVPTLLVAVAVTFLRHGDSGNPAMPRRLVVLPFVDLSPEGGAAILGSGLSQELTTQLARSYGDRLEVIASTSAMTYQDTEKSIEQIRSELWVDYVLEGSVRRAGDRLRITAQLIRASDQSHLWAATYDNELGDLLRWQSEVAVEVAAAAMPELLEPASGDADSGSPPVLVEIPAEAYESYLEGRYFADKANRGKEDWSSFDAARKAFERALALAPEAADIHARLAWVRLRLARRPADYQEVAAMAHRALELAPGKSRALELLAFLDFYGSRWESAERRLTAALDNEPALATAHHLHGLLLSARGRHEEAIAAVEKARRLDPASLEVESDRALLYLHARRYQEAIRYALRTIELDPGYPWNYRWIVAAALAEGDHALALRQARAEIDALSATGFRPPPSRPIEDLEDYWRWRLQSVSELAPRGELAVIHLGLSDHDRALELLAAGCRITSDWVLQFLDVDPRFDPLRGDPRFGDVLDCVRRTGERADSGNQTPEGR